MCILTTFTFLFKLKAALLTKRPKKKPTTPPRLWLQHRSVVTTGGWQNSFHIHNLTQEKKKTQKSRNHFRSCTVSCSEAWPLSLWLHHAPVQARTAGTPPAPTMHGARGLPVAPDVCRSVPGSPPRRCGSPSRGPIKTASLSQLCLPLVKQSGLRASLAEEVGYIWGVCFTATGCL